MDAEVSMIGGTVKTEVNAKRNGRPRRILLPTVETYL